MAHKFDSRADNAPTVNDSGGRLTHAERVATMSINGDRQGVR